MYVGIPAVDDDDDDAVGHAPEGNPDPEPEPDPEPDDDDVDEAGDISAEPRAVMEKGRRVASSLSSGSERTLMRRCSRSRSGARRRR